MSIWLEVNRTLTDERLQRQEDLKRFYREHMNEFPKDPIRYIPGVEVVAPSPLPVSALQGALVVDGSTVGENDEPVFKHYECVDEKLVTAVERFGSSTPRRRLRTRW